VPTPPVILARRASSEISEIKRLKTHNCRITRNIDYHVTGFGDHPLSILARAFHAHGFIGSEQGTRYFVRRAAHIGRPAASARGDLLFPHGGLPGELRKVFSGFDAVGCKRTLHVAGRGDCFIAPIVSVELVDVLGDQVSFDAVPRQKGQRFLENIEFS
jgi:hypothetical protein